jgi:hypothetical protein
MAMQNQALSKVEKLFSIFYVVASLLIFIGLILMCQPFSMKIYTFGFPTVLVGTVAYIIMDHLKK